MPSRDWLIRVEDMQEALARIQLYTKGFNFLQFVADQRTIDAVVRNLEIIGEAVSHLPDEVIQAYSTIPWKKMQGMRNLLIHEYFGINNEIIWQTILHDLPPLVPKLEQILKEKEEVSN